MKKLSLYLVAALTLMIGGATIWSYFRPPKDQTLYRAVPVPYIAERSPALEKVKTVDRLVPVKVFVPTPAQAQKLGLKEDGSALLQSVLLKPLPYGGTATVTVPEATPETPFPEAVVTVIPKKQPFFEWTLAREVGVGYGVGTGGRVLTAEFRHGLFRTGPVRWEARAGVVGSAGRDSTSYAVVAGSVRF